MRVLFLVKSWKTPSSRIRVGDLLGLLENEGLRCEVEELPKGICDSLLLYTKARSFDVVVLQKRLLSWIELTVLRGLSRKLVFDFDDAIYLRNASPSTESSDYVSGTRARKFKATVGACDAVVAANRNLAGKVSEIEPRKTVFVIPSAVESPASAVKEDVSLSSPPVLGWVGGKSTLRYLEWMLAGLAELAKRRRFVLRVVSDAVPSLPGVEMDFVNWSLEGQAREIAGFDIGLMPLSEDPFSDGKSAYKLIQYMSAGVPSVCSPVGMNGDIAGMEPPVCLAAKGHDEFVACIERLLDDEGLRRSLSVNGRRAVEAHYSREVVAKSLAGFLKSLG